MITISKKILAGIIMAAIVAAGGVGYYTGKARTESRLSRYVDRDAAMRNAIGTWKPQTPAKDY